MRTYRILALLVLVVVVALFTRNNAHALGRRALHPFYFQTANYGSLLAVLQPKTGARIASGTVVVQYALQPTATAQSTPTYELRLDAAETVRTADTSYTFTGVAPGAHTVGLVVLDANNVPVPNTQAQVQFTVVVSPGEAAPRGAAAR